MKPPARESGHADFLSDSFVVLPSRFLTEAARLRIAPDEFTVLVHLLGANQTEHADFLTPQEVGNRCGMNLTQVGEVINRLITRGFLSIGEQLEDGTEVHYYDFTPLWERLRGRDPLHTPVREWKRDVVSMFESEFGRPLSHIEGNHIRNWLEEDRYPDWLILEALKEAVLANKYSIRYIETVLFNWKQQNIRSRQDLDRVRQSYRERSMAKEQTAATSRRKAAPQTRSRGEAAAADARYVNFYKQFTDET